MTVEERYKGIQDDMLQLHKGGCLFLCILSIAEQVRGSYVDLIECIRVFQAKGWLAKDFTCNDSLAMLHALTGYNWSRTKLKTLGKVKDNEYTIAHYKNDRTGYEHFTRRSHDTLYNSVTVKEGKIIEYYIYSYKVA